MMQKYLITILFLFSPLLTHAQGATGLIAYWPLDAHDKTSSGTFERSGNGIGGVVTNATLTSGKIGQAYLFNGTNARIAVGQNSLLKPSGGITISAWVKPAVGSLLAGGTLREIYRKEDGNDRTLFSFQNSANCTPASGTGCVTLGISTGAGLYAELDAPITSLSLEGKWSLITATYDLTTKKMYLNGAVIGTAAATGNITTTNTAIGYIGTNGAVSEFFWGTIDDVRIYNRALSSAEIVQLYRQGAGNHDDTFLGSLLSAIGAMF